MNSNWSYSPETKIWVVTSVTLTFDLWPWPFASTLPWSNVITPENFMMIRWWEHSQKGVTDGQTDRRTDGRTDGQTDRRTENTIHRAAWSQLKISPQIRLTSDSLRVFFWTGLEASRNENPHCFPNGGVHGMTTSLTSRSYLNTWYMGIHRGQKLGLFVKSVRL